MIQILIAFFALSAHATQPPLCEKFFLKTFIEQSACGYEWGYCFTNTEKFVDRIVEASNKTGASTQGLEVLVVFPNFRKDTTIIEAKHARGTSKKATTDRWGYHVVAAYQGKIYDMNYGAKGGAEDATVYFDKMYGSKDHVLIRKIPLEDFADKKKLKKLEKNLEYGAYNQEEGKGEEFLRPWPYSTALQTVSEYLDSNKP